MTDVPTGPDSPSGSAPAALLSQEDRAGVLLLTVSPTHIDDTNADQLGEALENTSSAIAEARVVLSLENVEYLSSAALGIFIAFRQKLDREGGRLRLCSLQTNIAQVFRLTKLDRAFDIRPDMESALTDF